MHTTPSRSTRVPAERARLGFTRPRPWRSPVAGVCGLLLFTFAYAFDAAAVVFAPSDAILREDFEGETSFPTTPELNLLGLSGVSPAGLPPQIFGEQPPPPVVATGAAQLEIAPFPDSEFSTLMDNRVFVSGLDVPPFTGVRMHGEDFLALLPMGFIDGFLGMNLHFLTVGVASFGGLQIESGATPEAVLKLVTVTSWIDPVTGLEVQNEGETALPSIAQSALLAGDPFTIDLLLDSTSEWAVATIDIPGVGSWASPGVEIASEAIAATNNVNVFAGLLDVAPVALATQSMRLEQLEIFSTGSCGADGRIASWPFDGDAEDDDTCHLDGSLLGPTAAPDRSGQASAALAFSGPDRIDLGASPILKPELPVTVAMWIRHDSPQGWLFSNDFSTSTKYSGVWIFLNDGQLQANFGDGSSTAANGRRSASGGTVIPANTWTHVAAVIRGATDVDLYVDGVLEGVTYSGTGGPMIYQENDAVIGSHPSGNRDYTGEIDDVVFYSRALSAQEIAALPEPSLWLMVATAAGLLFALPRSRRPS